MALACRACRVDISASEGCHLCNAVRQNLVVLGDNETDAPPLTTVAREIVAGLRERTRAARESLKDDPHDASAERRLLAVGNTAAKVLEAARKLLTDGVAAIELLSFRERAELFLSWYAGLAPAYRAALRGQFEAHETAVARPVSESTSPS